MGYGRSWGTCALGLVLGASLGALLGAPATAVDDPTQYDPACPPAAAPAPESDPVRILLAGDSMTNGTSGDFTWRYFFDQRLRAAGVAFDLVGPWSDVIDYTTYAWGHHEYAACGFDQDHFARGGAQLAEQLEPAAFSPEGYSKIRWATQAYAPDVVVEYYGYNDLTKPRVRSDPTSAPYTVDELLVNAKKFINEVRAANPSATIVMTDLAYAVVPDPSAEHQRLQELAPVYNARLAEKVPTWSTAQSRVVLAHVADPAYWRGYADTYDGAHANAQGEVALAAGMADAFAGLGIGRAATLPLPVVPLGPRTVPQLAGSGGLESARLSWALVPGATRMLVYCREPAVTLAWTRLADVERTSDAYGNASPNAVTETSCSTDGPRLAEGHTYEFRIRAAKVRAVAEDLVSNTVSVTVPVRLGRVQGLSGTAAPHQVSLSWSPVSGADHYLVDWRKDGSTAAWSTVSAASTDRSIADLVAGQPYDFRVRAVGTSPAGPYADPVTVTPRGNVTSVPPKPTLVHVSGHRVKVYWRGVPGATRYQVQVRVGYGTWRALGWSTTTNYLTQRLVAGTSYAFRIRPYDQLAGGGISSASRTTA